MDHDYLMHAMDHIRDVLIRMIDATPEEHWMHRPGGSGNHVMWTLGHLAWADDLVIASLGIDGGDGIPGGHDDWASRFAWKTGADPDRDRYPSRDTLLTALEDRRTRIRTWFTALPSERLDETPPDALDGWFPCLGMLPAAIAAHEAMHVGQFQVIRRELDLAPVFT